MVLEIPLGAMVQLRKPHPCGGDTWTVVRLGADIGLQCCTCRHRVLLERSTLERRIKRFIDRGPQSAPVRNTPPGPSGTGGAAR